MRPAIAPHLRRRTEMVLRHALAMLVLVGVLVTPLPAGATVSHLIIKELSAGRNGDPSVQYVQIEIADCSQAAWGRQPIDSSPESREMLAFFDANGTLLTLVKLPDAPCTNDTGFTNKPVLIGTPAFQAATDLPEPDIIMVGPFIVPDSGKVCFKNNPANLNASFVNFCVSYGSFSGDTEGRGAPAAALPTSGFQALHTNSLASEAPFAPVTNSSFTLQAAHPTNSSGDTGPTPTTISGFNPTSGSPGASVSISGKNFNAATSVTFNATPASSFTVISNVLITATVPPGATTGPIAVTSPSGAATSASSFIVTTPPPNDDFADRLPLSGLSAAATGTNVGAGTEPGEPNHAFMPPSKTVWWTWTAPGSGSVSIDTFTSNFDTVLAVYTGDAVNGLTPVASNDQSGGTNQSRVTFPVVGGAVFQIVVGGFFGTEGDIALHLLLTLGPPTISGFEPSHGRVATSVTITGTHFTGTTAVRFTRRAPTCCSAAETIDAPFTVNSDTSITATVPTGAITGPIDVQTAAGTATSASSFTVDQAGRTFVSVDGNDANNCAEVATPCRSLDAGITQVAPGGEVIVLRTGPYGGATITKSVRVDVPAGVVAFTASSFVVDTASSSDVVVLRGLTIKALTAGTGKGVDLVRGNLFIEKCVIDGWDVGIDVFAGRAFVTDSTVRNSTSAGLRLRPSSSSPPYSVDRSRFEGTSAGCGIEVKESHHGVVRNSVASGNQHGLCVTNAGPPPGSMNVQRSMVANNTGSGLRVTNGGTARVRGSTITNNAIGLENAGGTLQSLGDNLVEGNGSDATGIITVVGAK